MSVIKIKLGMYYVPSLGVVNTPIGLCRLQSGSWLINNNRFPDIENHRHYDDDHKGSAIGSLYAALAELEGYELKRLRALETKEREIKVTKLDSVGICYNRVVYKGKPIHRFMVSTPGADIENITVYIGTDDTYIDNWDRAFSIARDKRHGYERERTIRAYWNGLNPQPHSNV